MMRRLISFLKGLPAGREEAGGVDAEDPRVAAAALMLHVVDADGVREDTEHRRLRAGLADAYSLAGPELDTVLHVAETATREAVDLHAFTRVVNRHLDEGSRVALIGLMWEIVYADGELHELEDNLIWRVAELIGVSAQDRLALRSRVRGAAGEGG